ncbi:MAG: tRNA uridine-5-carboxymethylaminomethyl(34) synthesis GTPase MnmE [Clostridiales bacterium]|nr:tRNA uridine-5-carboxymethylaminomethyl(34) synthesis GTPase MnmE [Clostridiales bacterium]
MPGTFCACSTPMGQSGIAVIRISGPMSGTGLDDCFKIIRTSGSAKVISQMEGYTAALADFTDPSDGSVIDRVVVTRFTAPHSYTGEDMTEISCHGGNAVKQEIFRVLFEKGIRPAEPGEFTKTAFVNGKLALSEAEAVMNVIKSESSGALKVSNSQVFGKLNSELSKVEETLYKALSLIEMIVEFPEHDDTPANTDRVRKMISSAIDVLVPLKDSYAQGRLLADRLKVALAGKPNSGKSTLLNKLTGFDRAIVTDIPGTTRDTLDQDIDINGIPVRITDTAGIRQTDDAIEAMGVERARSSIREADLCLFLISPDDPADEVIEQLSCIRNSGTDIPVELVFTKSDMGINDASEEISRKAEDLGIEKTMVISALSDEGIDLIRKEISDFYDSLGSSSSTVIISGRHAGLLALASDKLMEAVNALDDGLGEDIASSVIRSALEDIGSITGKTVSNELVNTIFSDFCIGK